MDKDLILAKAGSVKSHLNRVLEKRNVDLDNFIKDIDRQESILYNIQTAVQNCIDIAQGFCKIKCVNSLFLKSSNSLYR